MSFHRSHAAMMQSKFWRTIDCAKRRYVLHISLICACREKWRWQSARSCCRTSYAELTPSRLEYKIRVRLIFGMEYSVFPFKKVMCLHLARWHTVWLPFLFYLFPSSVEGMLISWSCSFPMLSLKFNHVLFWNLCNVVLYLLIFFHNTCRLVQVSFPCTQRPVIRKKKNDEVGSFVPCRLVQVPSLSLSRAAGNLSSFPFICSSWCQLCTMSHALPKRQEKTSLLFLICFFIYFAFSPFLCLLMCISA